LRIFEKEMANIELRFRYCIGLPGLLKWLAIIFSAIVLGLICWEAIREKDTRYKRVMDGEMYTVVVGFFTMAVEFLLLFVYFFNCHNSLCSGCRCRALATWIYLLCFALWAAAAGVQTWVTYELKNKYFVDQDFSNRRAASAAFCFANILVFVASLHQARYVDL